MQFSFDTILNKIAEKAEAKERYLKSSLTSAMRYFSLSLAMFTVSALS